MSDLQKHCDSIAEKLSNPPLVDINAPENGPLVDLHEVETRVNDEGEVEYFYTDSFDDDAIETTPMSAYDYLNDVLNIEYRVNGKAEYLSGEVLVAFGGPNIWIDTKTNTVNGAWWGDKASSPFEDTMDIDGALSELWESARE